jgi:polyphosphate:AMP phosphotransferase
MFEAAELGHKVDKEVFAREEKRLRTSLLKLQYQLLANAKFPVLMLIGGVDGAGKGETVNLLNEWMDPRHIHTHSFGDPSDEERDRPPMWRFWRSLPPKGRIGILFGSWYTSPIVDRVLGKSKEGELDASIQEIRQFEKMLADEGVLVLKFWFHLSKKAQKKRLKALESDPKTRWRVTDTDWERFKSYDRFSAVSEHTLRQTSTGDAPWHVVEGADPAFRYLTVAKTLEEALQKRLASAPAAPAVASLLPRAAIDGKTIFDTLDYDTRLDKKDYEAELEKWQGRLNLATRHRHFKNQSLILVFEGSDAAGKGGSIRRITGALDARHYTVIPVAAPTQEEHAQPYLWRFWRHLPRKGRLTLFDRSWYGRVLVERVEGYCSETDWLRAYGEINDFEGQLAHAGGLVCKFWLTITEDEQLRRFKEREKTPFKQFKITDDDWRNRKKWADYQRAASDMFERTSTAVAPWTVVPANDKYQARITVLETVVRRLEAAIEAGEEREEAARKADRGGKKKRRKG